MRSNFVDSIQDSLHCHDLGDAELILEESTSVDEDAFGHAVATFKLNDLKLQFVRDRRSGNGDSVTPLETVDVGLIRRPETLVPLEHLAVANRCWGDDGDREKFFSSYNFVPEDMGPTGEPFMTLDQALKFLQQNWKTLPETLNDDATWKNIRELEAEIERRLKSLIPNREA